jgi:hypothetical protein
METHHDIVLAFAGKLQAFEQFVQSIQLDLVELDRV